MPVWMEILLNVIGYGGFVAIAILHKPRTDAADANIGGKTRIS